jgi:hypothetical protein
MANPFSPFSSASLSTNPFRPTQPKPTAPVNPAAPRNPFAPSLNTQLDPNANQGNFKVPSFNPSQVATTVGGKTYNQAGDPVNAPVRPPVSGGGTQTAYASTDRSYPYVNTHSEGTRYDINGKDTWINGQPPMDTGPYTFNGGVNASGQQFPGFGSNSGSVVGTGTASGGSNPVTPEPPAAPDRFSQLDALRDSAAKYFQPSQEEQDAMQKYGNLLGSRDLGLAKIGNNPEPLELITGQSKYLQDQAAAQSRPLEAQLGILQARRQAAVEGYKTAVGAEQAKQSLQQPVSLGLGQALVSPTTGQQVAGNASYAGGGGGSMQDFISNLASQVSNGTAYNDALAQLPSPALAPMLLQAITKANPNFNITESNQNAQARAQQLNQNVTITQPLKLAMNTALDHIKGLQTIVDKVGYSDSPIMNMIRTGASNNIWSDQDIKTLQSQIGLVREEVAKVLGGGTATDSARADANSIIPENISPTQFKNVIGEVQKRMQEKIDEYSKLGNASQYGGSQSGSSGGGMFGSFFG